MITVKNIHSCIFALLLWEEPIDIAKLQTSVSGLEAKLSHVAALLSWATGAVVLGLVIEYWDDAINAIKALTGCVVHRRLDEWRTLERHIKTAVIGGVFITLGVGAELWYEHQAATLEADLETDNGKLVAFLNGKASNAEKEAGGANERAATLEGANQAQQGALATLSKEASDAKAAQQKVEVQLAAANRSVAEANLLADQERVKELALEDFMSSRVIGESTRGTQTSFDSLKPFSWAKARIDFPEGDAEAKRLAKGIEINLKMAGWQITPAVPTEAGYFDGVSLVTRFVNSRSRSAAEAVAHFLGGCSIDAFVMAVALPDLDDETVLVHVGLKPMPNENDHLKEMAGGFTRWTKSPIDLPCR